MNETTKTDAAAIAGSNMLADDALTENARNFLLGHDKLSLMKWKSESKENKIRWMEYLKPKEKPSPFFDECIRLINVGYS